MRTLDAGQVTTTRGRRCVRELPRGSKTTHTVHP